VSRSELWRVLLPALFVSCSVLLSEDAEQCAVDADCAELGFGAAVCASGVCVADDGAGASGGTGASGGSGASGASGASGGSGAVSQGGQGGEPMQGGGAGGQSGGAAGEGGSGGEGEVVDQPDDVRVFGDTLTTTAGGDALAYIDVCPEDQVLIGINVWTSDSVEWLQRGQAVCGTMVLTSNDGVYAVAIVETETLRSRGSGTGMLTMASAQCPNNEVVVGFDGREGMYMDSITLYCAPLTVTGDAGSFVIEIGSDAPVDSVGNSGGTSFNMVSCPAGLVARGGQIEAGGYFDAFGLVCGEPALAYPDGSACAEDRDCESLKCGADVCEPSLCEAPSDCLCVGLDTDWYLFCNTAANSAGREAVCAAAAMQPAIIDKGSENGWVRSTATFRDLGDVGLGASDLAVEGEWRWSNDTQFWSGAGSGNGGTPVGGNYTAWDGANQPDNAGASEHCLTLWGNSRWNDDSCGKSLDFVCEFP
jgi:hypothetical protein